MRREWRLRSGRDYQRVRSTGRRRANALFVMLAAPHPQGPTGTTRLGIVTGRRIGNAVVRNRVKRRLREIGRQLHPRIAPGWDLVVIVRPAIAAEPFAAIDRAMRAALTDLRLLEKPETPSCAPSSSV